MSIEVSHLTKNYGEQKALNEVSIQVEKGEIVGFLGPNGAGKSTLMKILTCFLPQTSGKALVCGFDVTEQPMEVKKRVGYLPEHNPLYLDMYVKEYLTFIAGLHQLKDADQRVSDMIETVGLQREQHKLIGALSKGYRQRVGLAQALIHDPEVLILDEPTTGLDPNQIEEIRNLIKNIGRSKTVIMSTHIMQEVEAICDRVIIINQGVLVADDTSKKLTEKAQTGIVIRIEFAHEIEEKSLMAIRGVNTVKKTSGNECLVESNGDIRDSIFEYCVQNGLKIITLQKEEKNLEEVFKSLTNK